MVKLLVALILLAPGLARANEIASDPPPTSWPAIKKSREHAFGIRFGFANTQLADSDRALFTTGVQWGVTLHRRFRLMVDYEWLLVFDAGRMDDPERPVRGRGHALRAGGRVTLTEKRVADRGRFYIDAEVSGGAMYLADSQFGRVVVPAVVAGGRFGCEMFTKEESISRTFDMHLLLEALVTEGDAGLVFGLGLQWAR